MVKNPPANAGDSGDANSIHGLGRSPGVDNATHSSILGPENPKDRGAWWTRVHGVMESQTQLSIYSIYTCVCVYA